MKKIYFCFEHLFIKTELQTTLDNCLLTSTTDDVQIVIVDSDLSEQELIDLRYNTLNKVNKNITVDMLSCTEYHSTQQQYYKDVAELNKKYCLVLNEMLDSLIMIEKSTDQKQFVRHELFM